MYLMRGDKKVLKFDLAEGIFEVYLPQLMPLTMRNKIIDTRNSEKFSCKEIGIFLNNSDIMFHYLSSRVLNLDRKNAKKILNCYDFSQSQDYRNKANIAICCRGVSLIDDFWISVDNDTYSWDSINFKHNPLDPVVTQIALLGSSLMLNGLPFTPELTCHGCCAKAWVRENDTTFLYKRSSPGGNESEIEISVSKILDCFNVNHVEYLPAEYLDEREGLCKCANMTSDTLSIVSAMDVYSCLRCNRSSFIAYCFQNDPDSIYKMCIVDYLISNPDRNLQNWGFYEDNLTGKVLKCHPLFNHDKAFDAEILNNLNGGPSQVFEGLNQYQAALKSLENCEFKMLRKPHRNLFLNYEMYNSFMRKAVRLGLLREDKNPFRGATM